MSNQNTSSVIFVCWGNICRSPMAEFVARKVFSDEGLDARITSAGVSDEEPVSYTHLTLPTICSV